MKKIYFLFFSLLSCIAFAQVQTITYSITPNPFEETNSITLTVNGSSVNEATWGITTNSLYLWTWSFDINDAPASQVDCPTNGVWTNSNITNKFTYNAGTDTYTITFVPTAFYSRTNIGKLGFLIKAQDGTGDKKSQDCFAEVGLFDINLTSPLANSSTIIASGGMLNIAATNTNGIANYVLRSNGSILNSQNNTASYSFMHMPITSNQNYQLEVTQASVTKIKKFTAIVNPGTITQALPSATLEDGINYNAGDATIATLVLNAPGKDFVYVAGSFNNWQPGTSYAMKKDPTTGKFWLGLTGLASGTNYSYQYWVVDTTPFTNSPSLVKTADPFSTLVLSPFDDPYIAATTYPNMPVYPVGQEREVTVLKTGQTAYPWSVTNFVKAKKEDLIVYEVLVRDFDSNRNFQDLINKINYFKNLKINAIELMPVMEFEGNESWGYNTSFHLALDKAYGTGDKMKEFIDLCHQNGIAVILDVALNHAFGRNPMVRMWMKDPDGDGWGDPSAESPYFNEFAKHSYGVGADFRHSNTITRDYTKRVVKHWINEFKIDGFRWDLTKGFTDACTSGDDACTNSTQNDRIAVLKEYADYSWAIDPTHYTIFEHLGSDSEEQQWANYRIGDAIPKGIMMWSEMTSQYATILGGFATNGDISRVGHTSHGFAAKRVMGYPESHDKERILYTAVTTGNGGGTFPVNNNLPNALKRMSAIGAASILVPGPKMFWHFADLGMSDSIYTCNNGAINTETDPTPGDCKLDTKPQPQWTNNWLADATRSKIYSDWAKMNTIKINEPVFEGDYSISPDGSNVKQRIYVYDNAIPATQLKNVVVLCNFSVVNLAITPDFPYVGTWYNLMDNSTLNVANTTDQITIPSGEFRVYGNKPAPSLSNKDIEENRLVSLYPNPTIDSFKISTSASNVLVYNIAGQIIKEFKGIFDENFAYSINELSKGVYFVKVTDSDKRQSTIKLVKE
jgi:Alpha amylase, catalytic domain/Secretion system C-terminal sorting domain